jgi:hypothetical protein
MFFFSRRFRRAAEACVTEELVVVQNDTGQAYTYDKRQSVLRHTIYIATIEAAESGTSDLTFC